MNAHLPKPFPNEPTHYREARNKLLAAEADLRGAVEAVAEERRRLPLGGRVAENYVFDEWVDGARVRTGLSDLFQDGREALILYSFMFGPLDASPCPACTSLLDGWNGTAPHINARVNLAAVSASPVERFARLARDRNWTGFRLLSSAGNTYNIDYLGQGEDGSQRPMCTVFVRRQDGIYHSWSSELLFAPSAGHPRHMDQTWPLWNILDLLPEGRGADWFPQLSYD